MIIYASFSIYHFSITFVPIPLWFSPLSVFPVFLWVYKLKSLSYRILIKCFLSVSLEIWSVDLVIFTPTEIPNSVRLNYSAFTQQRCHGSLTSWKLVQ